MTSWALIPGAQSASYTSVPTAQDNLAQFRCAVRNVIGAANSYPAKLTVQTLPEITSQPVDRTTTLGRQAVFYAGIEANPKATIRWERSDDGGNTWHTVQDSTVSSYAISVAAAGDNGALFRVRATNLVGTVVSSSAVLTLTGGPRITSQPEDTEASVGGSARFAAVVSPAPVSYQWEMNADGQEQWVPVPDSNSPTFTRAGVTVSDNGARFRCVARGANGMNATSRAATLYVTGGAKITAGPMDQKVGIGARAAFTVTAEGRGTLSYEWFRRANSAGAWTSVAHSALAEYVIASTVLTDDGAQFRVRVNNGFATVTSQPATLTVDPEPVITRQPEGAAAHLNEVAHFSLEARSAVSYLWEQSSDNFATRATLTSCKGPTCDLRVGYVTQNGDQVRCTVSNGSGGSVVSEPATLTVLAAPVVVAPLMGNKKVTAGSEVAFTIHAVGTDIRYQWQSSSDAGATWNDIDDDDEDPSTLRFTASVEDNGLWYHCVVSNDFGPATGQTGVLTVQSATGFRITAQGDLNRTSALGQSVTLTVLVAGGVSPYHYQWQRSNDNGAHWSNVNDAIGRSFTLANLSGNDNGAKFHCVATDSTAGGSTAVTSAAFTISVTGLGVSPSTPLNLRLSGRQNS